MQAGQAAKTGIWLDGHLGHGAASNAAGFSWGVSAGRWANSMPPLKPKPGGASAPEA